MEGEGTRKSVIQPREERSRKEVYYIIASSRSSFSNWKAISSLFLLSNSSVRVVFHAWSRTAKKTFTGNVLDGVSLRSQGSLTQKWPLLQLVPNRRKSKISQHVGRMVLIFDLGRQDIFGKKIHWLQIGFVVFLQYWFEFGIWNWTLQEDH